MFTEAGLEKLRAPELGRIEYGDSVVPGLMLRVSDSGVKSWSVLYKVKGEGGLSPTTNNRQSSGRIDQDCCEAPCQRGASRTNC